MIQTQENSEKAIQYLFGELSEGERDELEERLFLDEQFSLFLDSVEHDLIDDYVRGEMTAVKRREFEEKYLITEARREKVRVAGILQEEVFAEKALTAPLVSAPKASFWQSLTEIFRAPNLALAGGLAAILLFILIGGWLLLKRGENEVVHQDNTNRSIAPPTPEPTAPKSPEDALPRDIDRAGEDEPPKNAARKTPERKPSPRPANEFEKPEKREAVTPQAPRRVFAVTLLPVMRSGERPVLTLPKTAETVRLRVVHDNEQPFVKYRAEIRDQNGDLIWSREIPVNEKTLARPLSLNVRKAALVSGSYELTLSGMTADKRLEEIKFYNFTVKKK